MLIVSKSLSVLIIYATRDPQVARLHSKRMSNAEVDLGHDGFSERIEVLSEILDLAGW